MSRNRPSVIPTPPFAVSALLLCAFGYGWLTPTPEGPPPERPPAFDLSMATRRRDARPTPRPWAKPTSRS